MVTDFRNNERRRRKLLEEEMEMFWILTPWSPSVLGFWVILKNLTDFRKTVESVMDPRLPEQQWTDAMKSGRYIYIASISEKIASNVLNINVRAILFIMGGKCKTGFARFKVFWLNCYVDAGNAVHFGFYFGKQIDWGWLKIKLILSTTTYLGINFSANGNFRDCKANVKDKTRRSIFATRRYLDFSKLSIDVTNKLFDSLFLPILLYGSEV